MQVWAPWAQALAWAIVAIHAAWGPHAAGQYIPQSVLKQPPPEATTIKSWAFLKQSMGKLGDQVMSLMLVRKDVGAMQDDLRSQVQVWRQAEIEIGQENGRLAAQLKALEEEVRAGETVRLELAKAEQEVAAAKARRDLELANRASQQKRLTLENTGLESRRAQLLEQVRQVNASALEAEKAFQKGHLELLADSTALKAKIAELEGRLTDGHGHLVAATEQAKADQANMERHLADLRAGVVHVATTLKEGPQLQAELGHLQEQLKASTAELVSLQQANSVATSSCHIEEDELARVLAAEQTKASARHKEAIEYCQPIHGRHDVLQQEVAACAARA